jgi:hypothetical protein
MALGRNPTTKEINCLETSSPAVPPCPLNTIDIIICVNVLITTVLDYSFDKTAEEIISTAKRWTDLLVEPTVDYQVPTVRTAVRIMLCEINSVDDTLYDGYMSSKKNTRSVLIEVITNATKVLIVAIKTVHELPGTHKFA